MGIKNDDDTYMKWLDVTYKYSMISIYTMIQDLI